MSAYKVQFSLGAEQDLIAILDWIAAHDSPSKALSLIQKLKKACASLSDLPTRGHGLAELEAIDFAKYLQIHEGPYRIIYHTRDVTVYIVAVLDGRRDMQTLLAKRLMG